MCSVCMYVLARGVIVFIRVARGFVFYGFGRYVIRLANYFYFKYDLNRNNYEKGKVFCVLKKIKVVFNRNWLLYFLYLKKN